MKVSNINKIFNLINKLTAIILTVSLLGLESQYVVLAAENEYNDPKADAQWYLKNTGIFRYYSKYGDFWKNGKTDFDIGFYEGIEKYDSLVEEPQEVIVAVIDTGVNYLHPDLIDSIWVNENEIPDNGIDDDENGYIDDVYGWDFYNNDNTVYHDLRHGENGEDDHGTHIAGVIAARANNAEGIVGIGSVAKVKVMVLKVNGGDKGTGEVAAAVEAIEYAEKMGAKVCNISWGVRNYHQILETAIEKSNMLFVCAAGNGAIDIDSTPVYPASFKNDNILSVGYVDMFGRLGGGEGAGTNYGLESVDVVAPGEEIYSCVSDGYGFKNGTSMSTPIVSAIAAVAFSYDQRMTTEIVKEVVTSSIVSYDRYVGKIKYPGVPNMSRMMDILKEADLSPRVHGVDVLLSASEVSLEAGESFQLRAIVLPFDSTDKLSFIVEQDAGSTVLSMGDEGVFTADGAGEAIINVIVREKVLGKCKVHIVGGDEAETDVENEAENEAEISSSADDVKAE